jgi:predicted  nucleic acid-binding Zn-ribbon protein
VEDEIMRLEPRIARIEGQADHFNSRLRNAEVDLRDLRQSMDRELGKLDARIDKVDAKLEAKFEKLIAKLETVVEKLDAKI